MLASGSPRRREILSALGFRFEVRPVDAGETPDPDWRISEIPEMLAGRKAHLAPPARYTLAADTLVYLDDRILGKPGSPTEAIDMLRALSGQTHHVLTGVCLLGPGTTISFSESTRVHFSPLDPDLIRNYVSSGEALDKAGAYGIQDWFGMQAIRAIEGCYFNVMGLPAARLMAEIRAECPDLLMDSALFRPGRDAKGHI